MCGDGGSSPRLTEDEEDGERPWWKQEGCKVGDAALKRATVAVVVASFMST